MQNCEISGKSFFPAICLIHCFRKPTVKMAFTAHTSLTSFWSDILKGIILIVHS